MQKFLNFKFWGGIQVLRLQIAVCGKKMVELWSKFVTDHMRLLGDDREVWCFVQSDGYGCLVRQARKY